MNWGRVNWGRVPDSSNAVEESRPPPVDQAPVCRLQRPFSVRGPAASGWQRGTPRSLPRAPKGPVSWRCADFVPRCAAAGAAVRDHGRRRCKSGSSPSSSPPPPPPCGTCAPARRCDALFLGCAPTAGCGIRTNAPWRAGAVYPSKWTASSRRTGLWCSSPSGSSTPRCELGGLCCSGRRGRAWARSVVAGAPIRGGALRALTCRPRAVHPQFRGGSGRIMPSTVPAAARGGGGGAPSGHRDGADRLVWPPCRWYAPHARPRRRPPPNPDN